MKNMRPIIIVGLAAIIVTGCGGKKGTYTPAVAKTIPVAKVEPGNEQCLFPVTVGNYWVYSLQGVQQIGQNRRPLETELTFKVTAASDIAEGKKATIDIIQKDGTVAETQTWIVNKNGVYQSSSGPNRTPYAPMQPVISFPPTTGSSVTWKGSGITPIGKPGSMALTLKNLGPQEVDTETSRISAFTATGEGTFTFGKGQGKVISTGWFAPNVGMVRTRIEAAIGNAQIVQVFKLKKYEVK